MDLLVKNFDRLYKVAKNGKISEWHIWVQEQFGFIYIITVHGYTDGEKQTTRDQIKSGKNLGKANETSTHEQAVLEAESKWKKQKDKGYTEDPSGIAENKGGGFFPMLAYNYEDHKDKVKFPCFVQPKLDGLRATWTNGFYSRMRKPFPEIPHLRNDLERLGIAHLPLDGELYSHDLKDNFEEIVSMVKRGKTTHPDILKLEYHVFDSFTLGDYEQRVQIIPFVNCKVRKVPTIHTGNHKLIDEMLNEFLDDGYEGLMVRSKDGLYEPRRSYNLLKYKKFIDAEFPIIGIEQGRGKLTGHVGAFICQYQNTSFRVKMEGKTEFLKQCWEEHGLWRNKQMTVKFQGYSNKNNVPRFPVGLRIREDL